MSRYQADWSQANCIGQDTEMFMGHEYFPDAVKVCGNCQIAADCYFEAVKDNLEGCWGGYWHGTASAGANPNRQDGRNLTILYQAILCERLNMTLEQFVTRYGPGTDGMKKALRQKQGYNPSRKGKVQA